MQRKNAYARERKEVSNTSGRRAGRSKESTAIGLQHPGRRMAQESRRSRRQSSGSQGMGQQQWRPVQNRPQTTETMTLIKTRTTTVIEEGQDEGDDENDQQRGSDSGSARAQTNSDGEAQNDSVQSGLEMVRGWLMDKREGYLDERAQLHDELRNLDRTERGMHTVLELTSNPVVAQNDPEQCREGRERLAEVVRNNTIAEDRSEVQEKIEQNSRKLDELDMDIEMTQQVLAEREATDDGASEDADCDEDEERQDGHSEDDRDSDARDVEDKHSGSEASEHGHSEVEEHDQDRHSPDEHGEHESSECDDNDGHEGEYRSDEDYEDNHSESNDDGGYEGEYRSDEDYEDEHSSTY